MKENSKKFTNVKKLLVIFSLIICLTVSCKGKEENNNTPTPTAEIQIQEKVEQPSATPVPDNNDTLQEIKEISAIETKAAIIPLFTLLFRPVILFPSPRLFVIYFLSRF